jgi:anti-sigma B factor antagonist
MKLLTRTLAVVVLDGELDIVTAPNLAQGLAPVARAGNDLVLDLSAVRFCDCAGLNAFLRLRRLASTSGGSLQLAAPTAAVRRLIMLAQLEKVLPLAASVDEAISALGTDPAIMPAVRTPSAAKPPHAQKASFSPSVTLGCSPVAASSTRTGAEAPFPGTGPRFYWREAGSEGQAWVQAQEIGAVTRRTRGPCSR